MKGSQPRPLMEALYEEGVRRGLLAIAVAPTSYGKTAASPWMWRRSLEDGVAGGLVHVAPLRSLLWRAYEAFFKPYGGRLQMHGAPEEVKSPYLLSSLSATTLDSFLWNLYRIPVAEAVKVQRGLSMGHYYPALTAIYTSLIVFDEAHMYLAEEGGEGVGAAAVRAAVYSLSHRGVPTAVETATMRPSLLGGLARLAGEAAGSGGLLGSWFGVLKAPHGASSCSYLEAVRPAVGGLVEAVDPEWESEKLVGWRTRIAGGWDEVIGDIVEDAGRGPVLVVANTVGEAVRLYRELEDRLPQGRVVLVHGRLSEEDRRMAEREMMLVEAEGGAVVATQTAEAGVDANSLAVYTAAAPIESLVQRAGRACRRGGILETCREEGGRVVVVTGAARGPYGEGEVEAATRLVAGALDSRSIDWRAPCTTPEARGYGDLIAALDKGAQPSPGWAGLGESLLRMYLESDARPSVLMKVLEGLCGLARDSMLVEVEVPGSTVAVSLDWLLSKAGGILELGGSGAPLIAVYTEAERVVAEASRLWRAWRRSRGWQAPGCGELVKALYMDAAEAAGPRAVWVSVRFIAREGAYRPRLGLLLPGEVVGGGL